MTRTNKWLLIGLACWAGCSDNGQIAAMDMPPGNPDLSGTDGPPPPVAPGPSHGSAVALSPDDSLAVVVNRDVGTRDRARAQLSGRRSPAASAVAEVPARRRAVAGGHHARRHARVRRPAQGSEAGRDRRPQDAARRKARPWRSARSRPALALTPTGAHAWVANWVDGTLIEIDTATMTVTRTVDLNAALVATGILGAGADRAPGAGAPALARHHQQRRHERRRRVGLRDRVFRASASPPRRPTARNADASKQGVVYRVKLADLSVTAIALAPLADMGFKDHNNGAAGCYPNQLQSITHQRQVRLRHVGVRVAARADGAVRQGVRRVRRRRPPCLAPAGVTAQCAQRLHHQLRHRRRLRRERRRVQPAAGVCARQRRRRQDHRRAARLGHRHQHRHEVARRDRQPERAVQRALRRTANTPDDGTRRFPLMPTDIAFVPGSRRRLRDRQRRRRGLPRAVRRRRAASSRRSARRRRTSSTSTPTGIRRPTRRQEPDRPRGDSTQHDGKLFALVANDVSRNVSILDLDAQAIAGGAAAPAVVADHRAAGRAARREDHALTRQALLQHRPRPLVAQGPGVGRVPGVPRRRPHRQRHLVLRARPAPVDVASTARSRRRTRPTSASSTGRASSTRSPTSRTTRAASPAASAPSSRPTSDAAGGGRSHRHHAGPRQHAGSTARPRRPRDPRTRWRSPRRRCSPTGRTSPRYVQTIRSPRAPTNLDAAQVRGGPHAVRRRELPGLPRRRQVDHLARLLHADGDAAPRGSRRKAWAPPPAVSRRRSCPRRRRPIGVMRFGGANPAAFDQIQCVLRPVGTFAAPESDVATSGVFPELRVDMTTKAPGLGDRR